MAGGGWGWRITAVDCGRVISILYDDNDGADDDSQPQPAQKRGLVLSLILLLDCVGLWFAPLGPRRGKM